MQVLFGDSESCIRTTFAATDATATLYATETLSVISDAEWGEMLAKWKAHPTKDERATGSNDTSAATQIIRDIPRTRSWRGYKPMVCATNDTTTGYAAAVERDLRSTHNQMSSFGTCADKERRVVVVPDGKPPGLDVQFISTPRSLGAGIGATAKVGTASLLHLLPDCAFLCVWSAAVLLIISVAGVGVASGRFAGGSLISHGARASSHRRCLLNVRSAMVGLAVVSSGGGGGNGGGVHGKHVVQCGDPEVRPVEDNEDSLWHRHR